MAVQSKVAVAANVAQLRAVLDPWRKAGSKIALVPTMGALHEGHLALVRQAAASADKVVVSIFVNPAQFAPHEDFGRYPRLFEADKEKLERAGAVDLIYAPEIRDMYPEGFATKVSLDGPASGLDHRWASLASPSCGFAIADKGHLPDERRACSATLAHAPREVKRIQG
jgi:pantoate--beta-alanine ligase